MKISFFKNRKMTILKKTQTLAVGDVIARALAKAGLLVSWIKNGYVIDNNYVFGVTRVVWQ